MISLEDLERRVVALEKAQNTNTETLEWMAGTLGRVKATIDTHTTRLDRIDVRLDRIETTQADHSTTLANHSNQLERIERTVNGLKDALPGIVANAMRDVLAAKDRP